jgi:hypothetical protein
MQQNIQALFEIASPRLHLFVGTTAELSDKINTHSQQNILVCKCDAKNMVTLEGFYDELSRALVLPDYFGRNLNALHECLTDMEWFSVSNGILVIVENAQMLSGGDSTEGFLSILDKAGEVWSHPVNLGEAWDRPAIPFHAVLLVEPGLRAELDVKIRDYPVQIGEIRFSTPVLEKGGGWDKDGNIHVKPKDGRGPGDSTGININEEN